jgi:hypothetical protein
MRIPAPAPHPLLTLVPHSISTKGATLRPVPCSPFRDPLCLVATYAADVTC